MSVDWCDENGFASKPRLSKPMPNNDLIAALERAAAYTEHRWELHGPAQLKDDATTIRDLIAQMQAGQWVRRVDVVVIPDDLARLIAAIGKAEWGTTEAFDPYGHGKHIAESVQMTAEHFGQEGPQMMHGLYVEGTETVICHTGTSPNSPQIARALTGAWNMPVAIAVGAHGGGRE